jgi:hypothetical protein
VIRILPGSHLDSRLKHAGMTDGGEINPTQQTAGN